MLYILYVGIMVMVPGVSRNPGQMLYPPQLATLNAEEQGLYI